MEMKIAIRVDAVQVLMITRCLQRQAAEARLAGPAVWPQGCGLPVAWPILLKRHPEVQAGRPLVLRVPARMGERPRGMPPADCDLTADEVLLVMQVLWKWDGPSPVCRLWNLVYAALSWGVAQELADQGHGIDLATIAGRMAFCRLMEQQLRQHGAAKLAALAEAAEAAPKGWTAPPGLGFGGRSGAGGAVRSVPAGTLAARTVKSYAG